MEQKRQNELRQAADKHSVRTILPTYTPVGLSLRPLATVAESTSATADQSSRGKAESQSRSG